MARRWCFISVLALMIGLMGALPAVAETGPDAVDSLVKRSLPYIEQEGVHWIEQRKCVSCHQVPAMLWSLNKAAAAGFDVNQTKLAAWSTWSHEWQNWNGALSGFTEDKAVAGNNDTIAQLLVGRQSQPNEDQAIIDKLQAQLSQTQKGDGSWQAGGQLPLAKRPAREIEDVSTMWAMLALKTVDKTPAANYQKAMARLATATPGQSAEWWVLQSLVQREWGDKALAKERLDTLVQRQNADGGWGWLLGQPSDAFGTGLALYGLAQGGVPDTDPAVQKAIAFLQATQRPDGSWPVPGTRAKDNNQIKPTANYWGTAWAVIGLLEGRKSP